jgi:hypothetical protein
MSRPARPEGVLPDGGEHGGVGLKPPFARDLGEDRRAVPGRHPPDLVREGAPRVLACHLADQRLCDRVDAFRRRYLAEAVGERIHPCGGGCELARRVWLE